MARILVTNDDGIHSDGIVELARALRRVGEVITVAPAHEMSAASHSLTLSRPLRIDRIDDWHYSVDGTPTDCVTLAMNLLLRDSPPDLIVSGINRGGNVGDDVAYSGTVAGALEAAVYGIPGIAVSLVKVGEFDFVPPAEFSAQLAQRVLENGLPRGTTLNVNVPPGPIRGVLVTRQGTKVVKPSIVEGIDPRQRKYYWIGEDAVTWREEEGTDYEALIKGLVSITPLRTDMTDYNALDAIRSAEWHAFIDGSDQ